MTTTYDDKLTEITNTLELTFNEYFVQALTESPLSLDTKYELLEYFFAIGLRNKSQYRRSISHARHFENLHLTNRK